MKIPMFPCKYHQNGGFSMAMLVYREGMLLPLAYSDPASLQPLQLNLSLPQVHGGLKISRVVGWPRRQHRCLYVFFCFLNVC